MLKSPSDFQPVSFPKDFLRGAATSACHIEGAPDADGKGPSIWDLFCRKDGAIAGGAGGNLACDHYRRFKQDVALMKEMGLKAYRFSVAWPRILPEGAGALNQKGLGKPLFGLIHVDYATQQRTWKDSACWYREIIASNGTNL